MTEQESKHSVDFSNYNPYYNDVSEYIKACNKARFICVSSKDIEPFYTALNVLVNTTNTYLKTKLNKKDIQENLKEVGEFIVIYKIARKKIYDKNNKIPNSVKLNFAQREASNLSLLDDIQRAIINDLSRHKILPRVSKDMIEEDDGLPFT